MRVFVCPKELGSKPSWHTVGLFGYRVLLLWARGVFKTRPHRQVLVLFFCSEAGSRGEADRPMQQAKLLHRFRLAGVERCGWRAALAGRYFVQVWGRAACPFIFGLRVETKGRLRTLFGAKVWPGKEIARRRRSPETAEGPS